MHLRTMTAAAAATGMLLGGLGATTAASAAPVTRYHYSHPYVLYMANRDTEAMKVRPGFIKIMTGLRLSRLSWRYWNSNSGKGRGDVTDSAGRFPVIVWVGHPVWTPAPMGPTEFRTFKQITVHAGNGYFRYTWHQDYAMGGHWSLARRWAGAGLAPAGTTTQATTMKLMSVRLPVAYTGGWGPAKVRPGRIGFQDAGLAHLRWSQWSGTTAHGTGRFTSGVPGHMVNDAARVMLSNVKTMHKGTRYFAAMKVGLYKHGRWVGKFRAVVRRGYWYFI